MIARARRQGLVARFSATHEGKLRLASFSFLNGAGALSVLVRALKEVAMKLKTVCLSRRMAVACLAGILATSSGCGLLRRLGGSDTVDLTKAEVETMSVDIRRAKKSICPREPVQMAVFAKVKLEAGKPGKDFETWAGRDGVNKNDKMDFADFAFHSDHGAFDEHGWFTPTPNLLATVGKEIEIKSVFKQRPDKFSFTTRYKPDYTCITSGGASGKAGEGGRRGGRVRRGPRGSTRRTAWAGKAEAAAPEVPGRAGPMVSRVSVLRRSQRS